MCYVRRLDSALELFSLEAAHHAKLPVSSSVDKNLLTIIWIDGLSLFTASVHRIQNNPNNLPYAI